MKKKLIVLMLLFSIIISGLTVCMQSKSYLANNDGEIEIHSVRLSITS